MLRLQSEDFSENSLVFPSLLQYDGQLPDWSNIEFEKNIFEGSHAGDIL